MSELNDYSVPYRHDLQWEDFSKEFLIKLMYSWQRAYLRLNAFWYQAVIERSGSETADSCNLEVWTKVGKKVVSKFAKMGNFELYTVQRFPETLTAGSGQLRRLQSVCR